MLNARQDLIQELYTFAVQYARSCARRSSDADDFLQEILIVFLEVADKYQLCKDEMIKLAKTSARNRVRDLIRGRKVRFKYHAPLDEAQHVLFDEEKLRLARDILHRIESQVSARTCEVLELLRQGHSRVEVAAQFNLSQMMVHRCLTEAAQVEIGGVGYVP